MARGLLNKVLYGEVPQRRPTPYTPLYTIFERKDASFVWLTLKNDFPLKYLLNKNKTLKRKVTLSLSHDV